MRGRENILKQLRIPKKHKSVTSLLLRSFPTSEANRAVCSAGSIHSYIRLHTYSTTGGASLWLTRPTDASFSGCGFEFEESSVLLGHHRRSSGTNADAVKTKSAKSLERLVTVSYA